MTDNINQDHSQNLMSEAAPEPKPAADLGSVGASNLTNMGSRARRLPWPVIIIFLFIAIVGLSLIFSLDYISGQGKLTNHWQGIIPGKTTKDEVISKLGKPQEEETRSFGSVLLYDSGIKALPNTIIYNPGTGKVEGTLVAVSASKQGQSLYNQMKSLGKPGKIMYSRLYQGAKVYIFASKGITYSADDSQKVIDSYHIYSPTSLTNYLSEYGKYYSENDPFEH